MFGRKLQLTPETISIIEELGRHMPGGFFIYKAQQPETLLYANQAVFDIFGCDGLEDFRALTGFTFKGMLHPEDYAAASASIDEQIGRSSDGMDSVEYRIIRKDGEVRWVDDYGHYTETEAYGGVYCVFISDVTEKRVQQEKGYAIRSAVIQALTNVYNTVLLINDVATEECSFFHTDNDAVHDTAIRNAMSHERYTDTKTEYVETMIAPEDQERMQREISLPYILKQFEQREQFSVNFIRALESGTRHYRIDIAKVYMPEGRIGVMMGFKDVDAEVRAGRAMQGQLLEQERRRKEQDSMITAMASDYRAVYHVDLDADDAVCYRTDPNDPDLMSEGMHFPFYSRFCTYCAEHVDKDYQEGFLAFIEPDAIRRSLATENIIAYRYLVRRGGKEYYEMLRMAGVRHPSDRDDHIVHAVGLGFTVIDAEMRQSMAQSRALREALSEAEQASKAKTAFLSNMSHELRTPMNAIIGLKNIALNEPDVPDKLRDYLTKIGDSAQHLLSIINDILDMSRIESGRLTIKREEFNFAREIEQVNTIIGGQCRDKGLRYECHTVGRIDDYYIGDGIKLKQIVINILGNAVKFTPEGGTVSFLIEEGPRYDNMATLKFTMRDTGIGMSAEFIPRLFEVFTQEDSSATNRYGSTGLGMPITKSLVEMMNGSIEVESEKGKGTTFTVTLSLGESQRSADEVFGADLKPHEMRVLVVDNDDVALEHAQIILNQIGVSCELASSGQEALDMVRLHHARRSEYDLILVDWRMPGMDGVETTRQIRALGSDSPVIILTSYNWDDIVDEATSAGVDSFVPKPLFAGSVMDEFREAFKKRSARVASHRAQLEGRRVLLAEDVAINAEIMVMVLSMREVEADVAENGQEAVDMFAAQPPGYYDAILMDMRMPVMDGLEATRVIRAMPREDARRIPIIALTANAFDEDVQRSMLAGLNAHLSKPVETDALFETLETLIV